MEDKDAIAVLRWSSKMLCSVQFIFLDLIPLKRSFAQLYGVLFWVSLWKTVFHLEWLPKVIWSEEGMKETLRRGFNLIRSQIRAHQLSLDGPTQLRSWAQLLINRIGRVTQLTSPPGHLRTLQMMESLGNAFLTHRHVHSKIFQHRWTEFQKVHEPKVISWIG